MKKLFLVALLFTACSEFSTPSQATATEAVTKATLSVEGMTCGGCERFIIRTVSALPGVKSVTASHTEKRVEVSYDSSITLETIKAKIRELEYRVN